MHVPLQSRVFSSIAEQLVFGFVQRACGRGRGDGEIAGERAGRGLLGNVGPGPARHRLGAARGAHQLQGQPTLPRHWRWLLLHRHHIRQHGCLTFYSLIPLNLSQSSIYLSILFIKLSIVIRRYLHRMSITHYRLVSVS